MVLPKRLKLPTQLVSYQRLIKNFVQLPKVPKDSNKHNAGATLATGGNAGNAGGGVQSFVISQSFNKKLRQPQDKPPTMGNCSSQYFSSISCPPPPHASCYANRKIVFTIKLLHTCGDFLLLLLLLSSICEHIDRFFPMSISMGMCSTPNKFIA